MKAQTSLGSARWDRIFGALLVLVILLVLLVTGIRSCMRNKETPADSENTSQSETDSETRTAGSSQVYLSPSADTVSIAGSMREILEAKGYTVTVAKDTDNLQTRVEQSASLGCTAYVALQTSADSPGYYYHSGTEGSQALAKAIAGSDGDLLDETQRDLYELGRSSCAVCVAVLPGSGDADFAQSAAQGIAAYLEGGI